MRQLRDVEYRGDTYGRWKMPPHLPEERRPEGCRKKLQGLPHREEDEEKLQGLPRREEDEEKEPSRNGPWKKPQGLPDGEEDEEKSQDAKEKRNASGQMIFDFGLCPFPSDRRRVREKESDFLGDEDVQHIGCTLPRVMELRAFVRSMEEEEDKRRTHFGQLKWGLGNETGHLAVGSTNGMGSPPNPWSPLDRRGERTPILLDRHRCVRRQLLVSSHRNPPSCRNG